MSTQHWSYENTEKKYEYELKVNSQISKIKSLKFLKQQSTKQLDFYLRFSTAITTPTRNSRDDATVTIMNVMELSPSWTSSSKGRHSGERSDQDRVAPNCTKLPFSQQYKTNLPQGRGKHIFNLKNIYIYTCTSILN